MTYYCYSQQLINHSRLHCFD